MGQILRFVALAMLSCGFLGTLLAEADPAERHVPWCGDCIIQPPESCDDCNNENGDGCRDDCTREICGDDILDPQEECDDGNSNNNDSCLDTCEVATCGDGFVWDGVEECDDHNTNPGDCCSPTCTGPVSATLVSAAELMRHFPFGECDSDDLGLGTHKLGEMRDGAGNRFEEYCVVHSDSVGRVLLYTSVDGSCIEEVGKCLYTDGSNDWNIQRSLDGGFNCFTGSFWRTREPKTIADDDCDAPCSGDYCQGVCDVPDWKRQDFDATSCIATSSPSRRSSGAGVTLRHFVSADGPGGSHGDLLIQMDPDTELPSVDLPLGMLAANALDPCDNDNDGDCDLEDFAIVGQNVGSCEGELEYSEVADTDFSGCVTEADLEILVDDCSLVVGGPSQTTISLVSHEDLIAEEPTEFDVVAGRLSDLREDRGFVRATCVGTFTTTGSDSMPHPSTGDGRYYLARGFGGCMGYGESTGTPDPRDDLAAASPCP